MSNKRRTLAEVNPELAKQWHPTKNDGLKPEDVTPYSNKRVWWIYPFDDPLTGKHFDFEWQAEVRDRSRGNKCPFLSGRAVWPGFNDLASNYPELAKEWHPFKNGELTPSNVTCGTAKKVWWLLPYDDSEMGLHFDFEWEARIADRVNGIGCPYLSGQAAWPGFNDLASNYPELATEWHPTKNRKRTPDKVYKGEKRKSWWLCPKCGEAWQASVYDRIYERRICDGCKNRQKKEEFF